MACSSRDGCSAAACYLSRESNWGQKAYIHTFPFSSAWFREEHPFAHVVRGDQIEWQHISATSVCLLVAAEATAICSNERSATSGSYASLVVCV